MTLSQIIFLSAVQGITEFLPVSSSAHLVLVPHLLRMMDQGIIMDLAVHVGTLLAVLVYYRSDVRQMIMAVIDWRNPVRADARRLAVYIVLATIPALVFGAVIHVLFPGGIRSLWVIATTTLFFGALMGFADRCPVRIERLDFRGAMIVGFAQALALIPGTSRSGITMTAGRFLGLERVEAARFSFLLGIPATAAAGFLGALDLFRSGNDALVADAAFGVAFSFLAALAAIHFMMRWLKSFGLMPFVVYRLALGSLLMVLLTTGVLE